MERARTKVLASGMQGWTRFWAGRCAECRESSPESRGQDMVVTPSHSLEERVLALLRDRRDVELASEAYREAGIALQLVSDVCDLCAEIARGCGAVLLSDDDLRCSGWKMLADVLEEQPEWSALPVVLILVDGAQCTELQQMLPSIELIVLDQPVRTASLVAATRAALKSRNRQYAVRDQVEALRREVERREGIEESLRGKMRRLDLLAKLGERLLTVESFRDAASAAFDILSLEIGAQAYFNFLVQQDGSLRLDSYTGIPSKAAHLVHTLQPGEAACGLVAQKRESIGAEAIRSSGDPTVHLLRRQGLRAYYCTPLQVHGRLLGTLSFATRSKERFSDEDIVLLEAAVHDVALTFQRLDAESKLRRSEERFRVVQELSPDGFVILQPVRNDAGHVVDFIWLYQNPASARLTGTDPQHVVGRSLREVLPEHEHTIFHQIYRQVAETGEGRVIESPYDAVGDLGRVWLRVAVVPLGTDVAVLVQDTTDRKVAEEALRESERRYRELFQAMQDAFFVVEVISDDSGKAIDWRYLEVNRAVEAFFNLPSEGLIGRNYSEIVATPDPAWLEAVGIVAASGEPLAKEIYSQNLQRWLDIKAYSPRHGQTVVVARDITQRIHILEELQAREQQFRQLAEALPHIVWMARPDGEIDYVSGIWFRYSGITGEECQRDGWISRLHPDDREAMLKAWNASMEGGVPLDIEIRLQRSDDSYRWFLARGLPLRGHDNTITRWFGTCTDIEDQKQAREAAEAAARAKTDFMANMSHEIRTPLNGILGITDLLLGTQLSELQRQYMELVKGSGEALLSVVNDVLDFSKMEAGAMAVSDVEFELQETVQKVAEALSVRAFEKGLDLAVAVAPELPRRFRGDPAKLRQVLLNLLGNAVKFTHGGEISLTIEGEPTAQRWWRLTFSVRDTGIGIPEEKHAAIFESFSQVDASTARTYGGTGLGLAISKRLVEIMGGRIWLESTPGEGSTFSFDVELAQGAGAPATTVPRASELAGLRALVVEDHETNRIMLQRALLAAGLAVEVAALGEEGIRRASEAARRGRPVDFILVDLHLPDVDGFEVLRRLMPHVPVQRIGVLMITSESIADTSRKAEELGLAYVVKPIQIDTLIHMLQHVKGAGATEPAAAAAPPAPAATTIPPCTHVLVAEDNPVNLTVTEAMLRNAGARASAATNGAEAVNAATGGNFDVILMDVQMPEMDGFDATRRLREQGCEAPIIGLTAHALEGDRERCLAAGMDDYLSKPVSAQTLNEKVAYWTKHRPLPPADTGKLLAQLQGDRESLDAIVQSFLLNVPGQVKDVEDAAAGPDSGVLEQAAHRLKGAVSVVRAETARCLSETIEHAAKNSDLAEMPELVRRLKEEVARVIQHLEQLREPPPPSRRAV